MKNHIMIVDDEEDILYSLSRVLKKEYTVITADSGEEMKKAFIRYEGGIDLVMLDVRIGEENGLDLLSYIRQTYPNTMIVMISGYSELEEAVQAIKNGAYEFLEKPLTYQKVRMVIQNALNYQNSVSALQNEMKKYEIIGVSDETAGIKELITKAAATDFPVLITGESGVGKEHVARMIHMKSGRFSKKMIKLNCAAIPENLFESEIFGYQKGAFTGADHSRKGKIAEADKGSLFLDEIGELPLCIQPKLLRVLEEGEMTPLGSGQSVRTDFRLIAATNRDLKDEKIFRKDLYFRVGVLEIHIPPLRNRKQDVPVLAGHFLKQLIMTNGLTERHFDDSALEYLQNYEFPGNIRELRNIIQKLSVFSNHESIGREDIENVLNFGNIQSGGTAKNVSVGIFEETMSLSEAKKVLEKTYIETQLKKHQWNVTQTAKSLKLIPSNLSRKCTDLGIRRE